MLRYQHFTIGYAWVPEYGSSEEGGFDYLIKYSPLHTVRPVKFPAMLVTTGDHDDRVSPLHAYKYVATLQAIAGKVPYQSPLLL
jgi:prolyl oligopeptidase